MVLLEFSMSPMDKGESLSKYVAQILDHISGSGVTYQLTPMGTVLEGEWDEVIKVVGECFKIMQKESGRISMNLKMDYRAGSDSRMKSKIEKIEKLTNKKFK